MGKEELAGVTAGESSSAKSLRKALQWQLILISVACFSSAETLFEVLFIPLESADIAVSKDKQEYPCWSDGFGRM